MNRRHFAALLPTLAATLPALAEEQAGSEPPPDMPEEGPAIETGVFPGKTPPADFKGRFGHSYMHGMLPEDIGCEVHVSYLEPGTPHEREEKHTHSEIWLVREGKVELMLNGTSHLLGPGDAGIAVAGTMHWVRNAGDGVASYYVIEVGRGPIEH